MVTSTTTRTSSVETTTSNRQVESKLEENDSVTIAVVDADETGDDMSLPDWAIAAIAVGICVALALAFLIAFLVSRAKARQQQPVDSPHTDIAFEPEAPSTRAPATRSNIYGSAPPVMAGEYDIVPQITYGSAPPLTLASGHYENVDVPL
jgi:hypothetical protein